MIWKEQDGSAIVTVLVMITILSAFAGTIMAIELVRHRFIRSDIHSIQAEYAAEAGIYASLEQLRVNPLWRPVYESLELPADIRAQVSVEAFGGYYLLVSTGLKGEQRVTIRAVAGKSLPLLLRLRWIFGIKVHGLMSEEIRE